MLRRMSSQELTDWQAYAAIEPFGEERADMRSALIASVLANVHRDPKKRPQPFTIDDFMLFTEERELTQDEIANKVLAALGGGA